MVNLLFFLLFFGFTLAVLIREMKPVVWIAGGVAYLVVATFILSMPKIFALPLWIVILSVSAVLGISRLRRALSDLFFKHAQKVVPRLSKTEEEALNAGDTWIEKSIFRGEPDWSGLFEISTSLTAAEQSFIDNEVNTLCEMLHEWDITQAQDLPEHVWSYIKEKGFLGLVIPEEYGGKGFSARAHSDIVLKIASRSTVGAVTVMVPNSLGPGELLFHYGTKAQKDYYLPRLAQGLEIPCFALTEPEAGSDATSIQSTAIVVEKEVDGQRILGLSISLNKRWITLSSVATLIGVAVQLRDPQGLLDGVGQEGITCVLIPHDVPNLEIGNRHLPANQPFMNGTIRGRDIFVPIESIIGGQVMAGRGWQMLVECLSIGRSISLPALGSASSSMAYLMTSAFSRVRRQFNVDLIQFEGIEEKLAEIGGWNYLVNATRLLTVAAVQLHKKPSVASAITKYFNTELARATINHAMDVHGGRAVVMGPRNYLMNYYQGIPISVTVEGANIMTRNLLIFGQGSMACHPFIRDEFYAISKGDKEAFHNLVWRHITYSLRAFAQAMSSGWTLGLFLPTPKKTMKRYYQHLTRLSAAFAWMADLSLLVLGSDLKRKERLSARLGDAMSHLYLAMGVLRLFEENGASQEEYVHAEWALQYCFHQTEKALLDLCHNFPNRYLGLKMRWCVFPFGMICRYPSDKLSHQLARMMTTNNPYREYIKKFVYLSGKKDEPVDRVELTLQSILENDDLLKKVRREKKLNSSNLKAGLQEMVAAGRLTPDEMQRVIAIEKARWDSILVDEFDAESMKNKTYTSVVSHYPDPFSEEI
jgi:acyl-CoA dehydrogenase